MYSRSPPGYVHSRPTGTFQYCIGLEPATGPSRLVPALAKEAPTAKPPTAAMSESEGLSFKAKVTLAVGGMLTALAIEALMKLIKRLSKPKVEEKTSATKQEGAAPTTAAKAGAAVKAQVSIQYCGCVPRVLAATQPSGQADVPSPPLLWGCRVRVRAPQRLRLRSLLPRSQVGDQQQVWGLRRGHTAA